MSRQKRSQRDGLRTAKTRYPRASPAAAPSGTGSGAAIRESGKSVFTGMLDMAFLLEDKQNPPLLIKVLLFLRDPDQLLI
jgi:hypothetical protein